MVVEYALIFLIRVIGILSDFQIVKTILIPTKIANDRDQVRR